MVLTMKLTTFAFNVHDGRRPAEVGPTLQNTLLLLITLFFGKRSSTAGNSNTESQLCLPSSPFSDTREHAGILPPHIQLPTSPFVRFYFPAILVGPSCEFTNYMALIDESLFQGSPVPGGSSLKRVPSGRKRVAYRQAVVGLVFLAVFAVLGHKFSFEAVLTDWWWTRGVLYK